MTRNKILLILLVSGILGVIIYTSYHMLHVRSEEEYRSVSVILDDSSSGRWTAFREGLEQGASEEKIYINVVSTDVFRSVGEEASAIRKELENGVDGLIVEPCRGDVNDQLTGILPHTSCVLAVSGISEDTTLDVVKADWYEMGAAAAAAAAKASEASQRIGILWGNSGQDDMKQCLAGAREQLGTVPAEITWEISSDDMKTAEELADQLAREPVDMILSLDDGMTELASGSIIEITADGGESIPLIFGIGRSEKNIAGLDEGRIQALVVPDEYFMGYHCVKILAQKMGYYLTSTETASVPFMTVTKENMYDEDVESLLFPLVR